MSDKEHTAEQKQWLESRAAVKANKPNAALRFNNLALTTDGELCIGMTHDKDHNHYSCTHTQSNGVRDFGGARRWDLSGGSFEGMSDLNLATVQSGVRKI